MKDQKEEADKYTLLEEELAETRRDYFLWQIFDVRKRMDGHLVSPPYYSLGRFDRPRSPSLDRGVWLSLIGGRCGVGFARGARRREECVFRGLSRLTRE